MKRTELKRKAHPDSPWSSLATRTKPLPKTSPTARASTSQQQRVYRALDASSSGRCFSCGAWGPTDHSHN